MENGEKIAYCGLDCEECREWFDSVGVKVRELDKVLAIRNFSEISKEIPFMQRKYKGYKKLTKFFLGEKCPGCRSGGGNPFCKIRKCSIKLNYTTCAECESIYCNKFKGLLKIHNDGKIETKMSELQKSLKNL